MGKLISRSVAVTYDPLDPVDMEVALIYEYAARVDGQELAGLVGIIFFFYDVCYVFKHRYIVARMPYFVNSWRGSNLLSHVSSKQQPGCRLLL